MHSDPSPNSLPLIDVDKFVETGALGPFLRTMSLKQLQTVASGFSLQLKRCHKDQDFYSIGHILFDCPPDKNQCDCNISLYFPHPTTETSKQYDFSKWPDTRINWNINKIQPGLKLADAARMFPTFEERRNVGAIVDLKNNDSNVILIFDSDELILVQAQL